MIYHNIPKGINLKEIARQYIIFFDENCVHHMGKGNILDIMDNLRDNLNNYDIGINTVGLNGNQLRTYNKVFGYIGRLITELVKFNLRYPDSYKLLYSFELKNEYRNYQKINQFLKEKNIIDIDSEFSVTATRSDLKRGFPMSYRLSKNYRNAEIEKIPVVLEQLKKDLVDVKTKKYMNKEEVLPKADIDKAMHKFLKTGIMVTEPDYFNMDITEYEARLICKNLAMIEQGVVNFSRSDLVNRVHHVITTMPSEGRKYIKFKDGRNFASVDISCSHLFQLCFLYEEHTPELQKLVDADLYQVLADTVNTTRDIIKSQIMVYLFGGSKPKEISEAMSKVLPKVHKFITEDGENSYTQRAARAKVISHVMMSLESDFINDVIATRLIRDGFEFYTIHDSAFVDSDRAEEVKEIISETYFEHTGLRPRVKIEIYA